MTIVEGMKTAKDLLRKAEDLRKKIKDNCAHLSHETPPYGDRQQAVVDGWLQAHRDIAKEVLDLKRRISATNLANTVTIEIGGEPVTHTITEWVARRTQLAGLEEQAWSALTDRGLREGNVQVQGAAAQVQPLKIEIKRYFDPLQRDKMVEEYRSEPSIIDRTLEVVNATTQLVG